MHNTWRFGKAEWATALLTKANTGVKVCSEIPNRPTIEEANAKYDGERYRKRDESLE